MYSSSVTVRTFGASVGAVLGMALIGGCSFSDSSASISKSISSPIASSSRSSRSGESYRDEVRDFTASYLKSGGDPSKLKSQVGALATKDGVTDWERDEDTYKGIGAGLAKAGLTQAELEGYKSTIAGNAEQAQWMQDGYDSEH